MKISGCVIAFNEEAKIVDCLRSLDFCDEIILVDSFSTDKTVELAKQVQSQTDIPILIYKQKFEGYARQKNFAVAKCNFEWIYSLDADERVSDVLKDSILKLKQKERIEEVAFWNNRLTWYVRDWIYHGGMYPDRKIRFFKSELGQFSGINVHEYIDPGNKPVGFLSGDILHLSFDSIAGHVETINSFTDIACDEAIQSGKKMRFWRIIGHSIGIFVKRYFIKMGLLDGKLGFIFAVMSAFHVFTKYSKIWVAQKHPPAKDKLQSLKKYRSAKPFTSRTAKESKVRIIKAKLNKK